MKIFPAKHEYTTKTCLLYRFTLTIDSAYGLVEHRN